MKVNIFCGTLLGLGLLCTVGPAMAHPPSAHDDAQQPHDHAVASAAQTATRPPGPPGPPTGENGPPAPMEKIDLPAPSVSITIDGTERVIRANGLPGHKTGAFPNDGNPNALRPQQHEIRLPIVPTLSNEPVIARPEFGIAINGVIFDSGTGEFWTPQRERAFGGGSEWNYEALGGGVNLGLDMNNAHVQPTGKYHYHGMPTGLIESVNGASEPKEMVHLGWAFDGFPIYGPWSYRNANDATSEIVKLRSSYRLKKGERPSPPDGPGKNYDGTFGADWEYAKGSGDLDECNGRFGVTPEFPMGTYYYVITEEFPQIPRFWRGEPSASMQRRGPQGEPGGPGMGPGNDRGGEPRGRRPGRPARGGEAPRPGGPRPGGDGAPE